MRFGMVIVKKTIQNSYYDKRKKNTDYYGSFRMLCRNNK